MSEPLTIRATRPEDSAAISALHARTMGPGRFARTAYRVREGSPRSHGAISPFCRVSHLGERLIAAVRFTAIRIGDKDGALLLGPLAVDPAVANRGYGRGLAAAALEDARAAGIVLVVLVGDEPYYARLGFRRVPRGQIGMPGPVDPDRVLAVELIPGALGDFRGAVSVCR